jgi:hypothetical protein
MVAKSIRPQLPIPNFKYIDAYIRGQKVEELPQWNQLPSNR